METPITTGHVKTMLAKHPTTAGAQVVLSRSYRPSARDTVVLTGEDRPVGHFVCTWVRGGKRHFFDSYGQPPSAYGMDADVYGSRRYQVQGETCGRHCAYRLFHRGLDDDDYAALVGYHADPKRNKADLTVSVATP